MIVVPIRLNLMRFEILKAVGVKITVFWDIMPCCLVGRLN
jgi:hypothetical protein